jgi:hypothetical protein
MEHYPDRWMLLRFSKDQVVFYKVFATWAGSYLGTDSWQLNSGVTGVKEDSGKLYFEGASGSMYICNKPAYGTTGYGFGVLNNLITKSLGQGTVVDILPGNTDFAALVYN